MKLSEAPKTVSAIALTAITRAALRSGDLKMTLRDPNVNELMKQINNIEIIAGRENRKNNTVHRGLYLAMKYAFYGATLLRKNDRAEGMESNNAQPCWEYGSITESIKTLYNPVNNFDPYLNDVDAEFIISESNDTVIYFHVGESGYTKAVIIVSTLSDSANDFKKRFVDVCRGIGTSFTFRETDESKMDEAIANLRAAFWCKDNNSATIDRTKEKNSGEKTGFTKWSGCKEAKAEWNDDTLTYEDWNRLETLRSEQTANRPLIDDADKAAIRDYCWAMLEFEKARKIHDSKAAKEWQDIAEKALKRVSAER